MTPQKQNRQRLINRFIAYSGVGITLSALPDIVMGLWGSAAATIPPLLSLLVIMYYNKKGYVNFAGNAFIILYNSIIFIFSNFLKYEGNVQMFYIFIIFILPFLVDTRRKSLVIIHLLLLLGQFVLLEAFNYNLFDAPFDFTPAQAALMGRANLYIVVLLAPAVLIIIIQSQQESARSREEYTQHLQEKNEVLRQKNEELDRFAYSVSHDLRSPIASVLGLIELSKNEKNIDKLQKYNELKENSLKKLEKFISDILDHSRNSRMPVTPDRVYFQELVQEIFEQHRYSEAQVTATLHLNLNETEPFHSDLYRLKIILNNLISNSFRYARTDTRALDLHLSIAVLGAHAHITLADNGIGIAPEHLSRIFEMFYRANTHSKGSGLGLYIVHECVKTIQGQIDVSSIPAGGTTFRMVLPDLLAHPVEAA